jgi:CubicO group peptidase (beta-lactamase class C family)
MERRAFLLAMGVGAIGPTSAAAEWPKVSPQAAGFAPDLAERLATGLRSGQLPDIHAVLVARGGRMVLEHYGSGRDEAWGRELGQVTFGPTVLHDLRSVTKSVVGLLYGIALDRRLVPPPEAPLLAAFPEYPDLAADQARAGLTVGHALGMTMGTDWDETSVPYTDPRNSEIAMEMASDRLRFVLGGRVVKPPGQEWTYSGGAVAVIGALIARGTGKTLQHFAAEALFTPLGITRFEWARGSDGVASAASGLRLLPRDLLRIGTLVLAGGEVSGRQLVSRAWLEASLRPAVPAFGQVRYGRLWYVGEVPVLGVARTWVAGFGNGGQLLWVMPSVDMAVVITAGRYNKTDQLVAPVRIWREIILASIVKA